jgi:hypothetical protein
MLMKRVWGHLLAGVSVLTGVVAAMSACKHDDSTLFVQDVLAAQPVTAGAQCTFTADPTQPFISSGVLDIGFRQEYDPTYLIANQAVAEANSQQLATETNIITVQGAVVRITDAAGNQLNTFTRLASATVYPTTGTVPGYAPITVTTIDSATLMADSFLQANAANGGTTRLVTYVKFFGQTTGGDSVESDEFEFPVDVCKGCLVEFGAADVNTSKPLPNCFNASSGASTTSSSLPSPCVLGQDFGVDCSLCLGYSVCQGALAGQTVTPDAGAD